MNQSKLFATKKKLTTLFTLFIFWIISIFWIIFFTGKYFNSQRLERLNFFQSTQVFVNEFQKNPENFLNILNQIPSQLNRNPRREPIILQRTQIVRNLDFLIFNFQDQLIAQNIRENIPESLFEKTLIQTGIIKDFWFIAQTIKNNQYTFVFFQKEKYSWEDFFEEIFLFLLINIIFTLWFAIIWWYFVKKILSPVEQNMSDMNDFIHNAWHELKTPLAVTSTNLQLLSQLKNYDEDLIKNSISEIQRMDQLISWLSQLSDIQTFSHQEKFNLLQSIEQIISEYQLKIQEKNITITQQLENISFYWNKTYFEILFANLLSNAIKYNQENWNIKISLTKKYLRVENTWNIITDEQKEKIFERFYRIETARSSEWFGIWLSLVKKICDIFSWNIRVKNTQSTNIFEIEL